MFCSGCGTAVQSAFSFCPSCGGVLKDLTGEHVDKSRKRPSTAASSSPMPTFNQFAAIKADERKANFKKVLKKAAHSEATINVALMEYEDDSEDLKPVRGSSLPLKIPINATYTELLDAALKKREAFDKTFRIDRGYVLAYQDTRIARFVPETEEEFVLKKYKNWLGRSYSRLTLYLSPTSKHEDGNIFESELVYDDVDWSDVDAIEIGDTHTSEDINGDGGTTRNVRKSASPTAPVLVPTSQDALDSFMTTDFLPVGLTESEAMEEAIQLSLQEHDDDEQHEIQSRPSPEEMSEDQFTEQIKSYANQHLSGPQRKVVVSRASIWATAMPYFKRKKFVDGKGLINVTFATFEEQEDAVDLGGPRREFFHLLLGAICKDSKTVSATPKGHVIRFNMKALKEKDYFTVGLMLSTIVMQGGEPPRLFSPSICQFLSSGLEKCTPSIEEIPKADVQATLRKLLESENQEQVDQIFNECEWRFDIEGLPLSIPIHQRNVFINEVAQYYVILHCKAMLDQLVLGLQHYQLLDLIRRCNGMAVHLFQHQDNTKLTAKQLKKLLKPGFSPHGSNRRQSEEIVMSKLLDFVNCIEDGTLLEVVQESFPDLFEEEVKFIPTITTNHLLMFCTGAALEPVTGFDPLPSVTFVHDEKKCIPSAQTCSNVLYLYVNETTVPNSIHRYLVTALMNGGVFSKI